MNTYGENERMSDFNFFVEHYDELFEKYGHKFIVIRYHEILGAYDTLESAINVTSQSHRNCVRVKRMIVVNPHLGAFLLQTVLHALFPIHPKWGKFPITTGRRGKLAV